jgi:hypothetical protein
MMELLHYTGVRLGLLTNGEQWMLVDAPSGETTGFTSWYAGLWFEESLTLRAFRSLLSTYRFFGVPDDQTLEALLGDSSQDQHEVTDQLGYQVRRAVEILIQAIDRADQDRSRELLEGMGTDRLYEAALTVMMQLVFLLSAEERKLLPLDDPFYAQYYAVSTLRAQLHEVADQTGEEVLESRAFLPPPAGTGSASQKAPGSTKSSSVSWYKSAIDSVLNHRWAVGRIVKT